MTAFRPEPSYRHDQAARIGVLLVNLGTPEAPTAKALRPYLKEFLSDRRVVEIPKALWWLILNGIILNLRPRKSAEKYAAIWTPEGSPLKVHTLRQTDLLRSELANRSTVPLQVEYAMRYGAPSIQDGMDRLRAGGCDRILVIPLYPQYAGSSSATALDAVYRVMLQTRNMPELRAIRHFHDHPGYIEALRAGVERYWAEHGRSDKLIMSFHGVPRRTLDLGDPYHCECQKTGRLLAEALGLEQGAYQVCFQSRFGRAAWLQPYTSEVLVALGKAGTKRVDVICPGFVSDCLETLEEIAMEGKATFLQNGGGEYHYIPALNEHPLWISALADMVMTQLAGWLPTDWSQGQEDEAGRQRAERAKLLGADR